MNFIYSLQSEWLKTKRSAASWLCVIGGFFIPLIYFIVFLKDHSTINAYGAGMWEQHFSRLWRDMAIFLLPMGVILSSSLITQMEYKNNTWKQLHTTPQSFTNIFFAKFSVIILMTFKFFVFFNIGILLSAILPTLMFEGGLPHDNIPVLYFLKGNANVFLTCLPIIAIQYLISLNFKNFLVPIGIGMLGLIGSLIGMMWKYIWVSPYSYPSMSVLKMHSISIELYAAVYFILIMTVSYILYIRKSEKG
jgi:lantibiotic transport system permease protein